MAEKVTFAPGVSVVVLPETTPLYFKPLQCWGDPNVRVSARMMFPAATSHIRGK